MIGRSVDILFRLGSERELDTKLDELVKPILQAIHTDEPDLELDQMLRTLRLVSGTDLRDVNAQCLRTEDSGVLIHVGRGLYKFLHLYAQCASTRLLSDRPGGSRSSAAWSRSLPALASCLEWLALPLREVRFAALKLSPMQDNWATVFGNMTYRAAICHEIAHAVLGHHAIAIDGQEPEVDEHQKIFNTREREIQADGLGMRLHLESLPDPDMRAIAAGTLIYNVHATSLLKLRLMALAEVVDTNRWTARVRHPVALQRFAFLIANAKSRYGPEIAGLMTATHDHLETIDGETRESMDDQQGSVRDDFLELARLTPDAPGGPGSRQDELLSQSPVGVIRALDLLAADSPMVAAQLAEAMPRPVQRFVALPLGDRTGRVLNRIA